MVHSGIPLSCFQMCLSDAPHIGHLYTALLADSLNRWKLLKGGTVDSNDSLFTTGTDEHGLKIQRTAIAAGCDPQSYCDNISIKFKDLFRTFGIQPNDFIRTTEARHKEVVKHVWMELDKRGQIQRGRHEGWYSTTDECFYANNEVEKLNGQAFMVSRTTGSVVEWVQEENYVFPLSKYLGTIRNWLSSCDVIRPKVYFPEALQQASIEGNLSLSRDRKRVSWGITVPNDESQTIYVWFDALMNYLTLSGVFSNRKRSSWPPTCQIVGKDILKFHAVIWPAFLLALDLPLPKRIFVHGHWLVNGAKMSKSVGNVVDPFFVAKSLSEEGLRYFLLRQGTPQSDANFIMSKAVNVINTDLVNNVGNLLQRSTVKKLNPSQTYPIFYSDSFHSSLRELGEPLIKSINCLTEVYEKQFDELMIYKALELLMEVMRQTNGFFQFYEPWREIDDRKVSSLLYICYEVLRICGILLQPAVPYYADHLLNIIMSDDDRPKKRAKKTSHECTVILVDVGANMNREEIATTDMELAKDAVEWIITRKIFTESTDEFTLVLFGSEVTQNPVTDDENIFFCDEEMQQAKIDWLRFIAKEIKPSKSVNGDFLAALIIALDYMRNYLGSCSERNITARNILLITNLGGLDENVDKECVEAVVNGMKALGINFSVIGPSVGKLSKVKEEIISSEESAINSKQKLSNAMGSFKMESAECIITNILKEIDGVVYSFAEALPLLQRFVPRKVNLRGQKFYLELGIDLKIPLQMYKKIQMTDFKLAAEKYSSATGIQLKRKTVYEKNVKNEEVGDDVIAGDVDSGSSNNLSQEYGPKIFEGETVKGYKFGTTIVPYNDEDQKEYGWKQENRCLKLIQFTKRSQILEYYLMDGGAYYFIPPALDKNACIVISALVNAMIGEDSVALTRYVYNAASQPRIMGLFPKRSKKGIDMFVGIQLPFYEDFRGLDFPQLDNPSTEPKSDHLDAMVAFVKAMDLTKAHFNSETGQFEESLRPRDVPNPKLQNVCKAMKFRALHPNTPLPIFEDKLLGGLLEPNALLLKSAKLVLNFSYVDKTESLNYLKANLPTTKIESPSKKQRTKEMKEEILPRMSADNSVLPESGKFIKTDEVDA
uniref:Methionine--tRNA ligase, mitochondrial n=1 Tax=Elaeophora elaphi TaxID=1147741 RepID=A0A158Q7C1_9BILA